MLKCCVRDWFLWERCGCDGVYLIVYTHNCVLKVQDDTTGTGCPSFNYTEI